MATLLSDYYGLRIKHCTELGQLGPITENIDFHLMQSIFNRLSKTVER
jgi:hypothetical protein